jgi:hypothetical protein
VKKGRRGFDHGYEAGVPQRQTAPDLDLGDELVEKMNVLGARNFGDGEAIHILAHRRLDIANG